MVEESSKTIRKKVQDDSPLFSDYLFY